MKEVIMNEFTLKIIVGNGVNTIPPPIYKKNTSVTSIESIVKRWATEGAFVELTPTIKMYYPPSSIKCVEIKYEKNKNRDE